MSTNDTLREAHARKSAQSGAAYVPKRTKGKNTFNEIPVSYDFDRIGAKLQEMVDRPGPPAVNNNSRQKSGTPVSKALQKRSSHKADKGANRSQPGGRGQVKGRGSGRGGRSNSTAKEAVSRRHEPKVHDRRDKKGPPVKTNTAGANRSWDPKPKLQQTFTKTRNLWMCNRDIPPRSGHETFKGEALEPDDTPVPIVKSPLGRKALSATDSVALEQLYDLADQKFTGTVVVNQSMDTAFDVLALWSGSALRRDGADGRAQLTLNVPKSISPNSGQMVQTPFSIDLCQLRYAPRHLNGRDFVSITVLTDSDGPETSLGNNANLKMTYALAYIKDLKPKLAYMVKMLSCREGEYLIQGKWKADALSGVLLAFLHGVSGRIKGTYFVANEDQDAANADRLMVLVRDMNGVDGWEAVIGMTSEAVASLLNVDVGDADISMPIRKDPIPVGPLKTLRNIAPALSRVDLNRTGFAFVMWSNIYEAGGFLHDHQELTVYCHAPQFSVDGVVKPHFHVCRDRFNVFADMFEKASRALEAPVVLMMKSKPGMKFLSALARWMEISFFMCKHTSIKVEAVAIVEPSDSDLAGWYHVRYLVTSTSANLTLVRAELASAFDPEHVQLPGQPDFRCTVDESMADGGASLLVTGGEWKATPSSVSYSQPLGDPLDHVSIATIQIGDGSRVPVVRKNVFAHKLQTAEQGRGAFMVYAGSSECLFLTPKPDCAITGISDMGQWDWRSEPALAINEKNHFERDGLDVLESYRGHVSGEIRVSPSAVRGYAFDVMLSGVLDYALGCYRKAKPPGWKDCRKRLTEKFHHVFAGQGSDAVLNLHLLPGEDLMPGCESLAFGKSDRLITSHDGRLKATPVGIDHTGVCVFFDEVTSGYGVDTAAEAYDSLFLMIGHLIAGCSRRSDLHGGNDRSRVTKHRGDPVNLVVNFYEDSKDEVWTMCKRRFGRVFTGMFLPKSGCKSGGFVECSFTMKRGEPPANILQWVFQNWVPAKFPESDLSDFLLTACRAGVRLSERTADVVELTSDQTCNGRLVFGVANGSGPGSYVYTGFHHDDLICRTYNGIVPSSGTDEYIVLADSQGCGYVDVLVKRTVRERVTLIRHPSLDVLSCHVQPRELGSYSTVVASSNEDLAAAVCVRHSSSFLSTGLGADGEQVFTSRGVNGKGGVRPKFDISYTSTPVRNGNGNVPYLTKEFRSLSPNEAFKNPNSQFTRGERYAARTDEGFPGEIRWSVLNHNRKKPGVCLSPAELYRLLRPVRAVLRDGDKRTYYYMWMAMKVGSSTAWKCLTMPSAEGRYADHNMLVGDDQSSLTVPCAPGVVGANDGTFYGRVDGAKRAMEMAVIKSVKDAVVVVIKDDRVTGKLSLTGAPGMKSIDGIKTHLTVTDIMRMPDADHATMADSYLIRTDVEGGFRLSDALSHLTMGDKSVPAAVAPYKHKVNIETVLLPIRHGVKDPAICLALIAVGLGSDFHLGLALWWFSEDATVPLSLVGNGESLFLGITHTGLDDLLSLKIMASARLIQKQPFGDMQSTTSGGTKESVKLLKLHADRDEIATRIRLASCPFNNSGTEDEAPETHNFINAGMVRLENSLHFVLYAHIKSRKDHDRVAQSLYLCRSVDGQNNRDVLIIYPVNEAWSDLQGLISKTAGVHTRFGGHTRHYYETAHGSGRVMDCGCSRHKEYPSDELLTVELAGDKVLIFKRGMAAKLSKRMDNRRDDLNTASFMNVEPFMDELLRGMVLAETPMSDRPQPVPLVVEPEIVELDALLKTVDLMDESPVSKLMLVQAANAKRSWASPRRKVRISGKDPVDDLVIRFKHVGMPDAPRLEDSLVALLDDTLNEFFDVPQAIDSIVAAARKSNSY